jgi:osmotically-inducible protein OsmY
MSPWDRNDDRDDARGPDRESQRDSRHSMTDRGAYGALGGRGPRGPNDADERGAGQRRGREDEGGYGVTEHAGGFIYGDAPDFRGYGPAGYAPRDSEAGVSPSYDVRNVGSSFRQRYGSGSGRGSYGNAYPGSDTSHRGRGPRGYVRADARILEDINERLSDDDELDATNIEVSVSGGVATLTGTVTERWMKHRAEDIADQCGGVSDVVNQIKVQRSQHGFLGSLGGSSETR